MIAIKNFSFSYLRKQVLKNINLHYSQGNIYYLLGPNGAGKSTLLRSIAGLHQPLKGSIQISNYNAFERNINVLENLYFLSEDAYYPDMSIVKFIVLYKGLYPLFNEQNFYAYLKMFGIERQQQLSALSFGQKRKVYVSFAFATDAKVILLDEPTKGLDINSKMLFKKILATSADHDRIIIISTHDVTSMDIVADGITVLDQQEVVFHQSIHTISERIFFDFVTNEVEAAQALYSEQTYQGFLTIVPNLTGMESNLNIELLYRGLMSQPQKITSLFN